MAGNDDDAKPAEDDVASRPPALAPGAGRLTSEESNIEETLDATVAAGASAPAFETRTEKGYDPSRYQDTTRSTIAYWLLALLTMMVLGAFILLFALPSVQFESLKSILELLYGPIVALVSAATGFYFGAQQTALNSKH